MTYIRSHDTNKAGRLGDRKRRIYDFLKERHTGVLSSVTPDNNPHGAVVYYTIDERFNLRLLTKTGTRKYENIVHNPHVMLTVFDPQRQATAQITGVAMERGGSANINRVMSDLFGGRDTGEIPGLPPIVKLQAGPFTTFHIKPVQIRMAIYAKPDSGEYDELFDSIESFELNEA